jgi:molecular chaperone GrpE
MQDHQAGPFSGRMENDSQPESREDDASGEPEAAAATGADEDSGPGSAAAEPSAADVLAETQAELARHREAMLRMQAEMENLRKRTLRDAERSRKFALERILKDLLQVRDSMERGLDMADGSATVESLIEGEKLTLKMLAKLMQDHGLEVVDPVGEPFDPELHEAMTVMPSGEVPENTVLEVLQKGFKLHDRLIRPARVIVSGKP